MAEEEVFTAGQLRTPRRPLTLRRVPGAFHPSTQWRCATSADEGRIRSNAIRHCECVRTGRPGFVSLRFTNIGQRLPVRVHIRLQISTSLIGSHDSRITEIQPSEACGTSEIPEPTSGTRTIFGTETISGMRTISEMEIISVTQTTFGTQIIFVMGIIIFAVTGRNTFSRGSREIGSALGTAIATTGGMVTDARSLMERG